MLNSRRTLRYCQSVSEDSVRAPHTRMPRVPNGRMALMPIGLRMPCSFWVTERSTSRTPRRVSLAGAFHTPRLSSVRAHSPATWPDGGTRISELPFDPVGFSTLIHG